MTSIKIGRKELLSFAERHSDKGRLRDYTSLADGSVLCDLFSLIFPKCKVLRASEQTLAPSQRSRLNWESLYKAFARLYIPLELLHPDALAENHAEKGFSTLVLFYFLYHLSKRADFSAEFAMDVTEELTAYLQSIDSIASLLLGEAMDFEAVPDYLVQPIHALPAFHATPAELARREEEAVTHYRTLMNLPLPQRRRAPSAVQQVSAPSSVTGEEMAEERRRDEEEEEEVVVAAGPSCTTPDARWQAKRECHGSRAEGRVAELERLLEEKRHECEALKSQNAQSIAKLSQLKAQAAVRSGPSDSVYRKSYEDEVRHAQALAQQLQEQVRINEQLKEECALVAARRGGSNVAPSDEAINALLDDVVDPESQERIDVHTNVNLLHCLLLERLQQAPSHREQAQTWLWSILSAYHVLETRLVTAVDIIDALQSEVGGSSSSTAAAAATVTGTRSPTPAEAVAPDTIAKTVAAASASPQWWSDAQAKWEQKMAHLREAHDSQLEAAHVLEHQLRSDLQRAYTKAEALSRRAALREAKWRQLCASLHEVEQTVFTMMDCEDGEEMQYLAREREERYEVIERITAELLHDGQGKANPDSPPRSTANVDGGCRTLEMRLDNALEERAVLLETVTELREALKRSEEGKMVEVDGGSGSKGPRAVDSSIHERVSKQKAYEDTEVCSYRSAAFKRQQSQSSSKKELDTSTPIHASSAYGKNLSKLLAEASSPYEYLSFS